MTMILPSPVLFPSQTISKYGAANDLVSQAQKTWGEKGLIVHGRSLARSGRLETILGNSGRTPTENGFSNPFIEKTSGERVSQPVQNGQECPFSVKQPTDKNVRSPFQTLGNSGVSVWCHTGSEPTVGEVDILREKLCEVRPDWVAAIGGGSVIDLAKAAVGLCDAPKSTAHYQTHPAEIPPATLPFIAAPTTAGTGAEATVVSVLTDPERTLKQSIRHASYMPRLVVLDPALLEGCPPATIAAAGLDAFIQAFESLTSRHATAFTRSLSELALVKISAALEPLYAGDQSFAADMLEGSYLAGLALSHARLGIIHGLAHPLGVRYHAAHGLVCACCLPAALEFNRDAIAGDLTMLRNRYNLDIEAQVSRWLAVMKLESPFAGHILTAPEAVIAETLVSGSTGANPRPVTAEDVSNLLKVIFENNDGNDRA